MADKENVKSLALLPRGLMVGFNWNSSGDEMFAIEVFLQMDALLLLPQVFNSHKSVPIARSCLRWMA